MRDFDPKTGIFQPFERFLWSKGCSFLCFGNFVGRDKCDFQPIAKNQNTAVWGNILAKRAIFTLNPYIFSLRLVTQR